jgi:hypothetical protein
MEKQIATSDGVMCRAKVSSELVQSVVSNKDTGRKRTALQTLETFCSCAEGQITL